MVIILTSHLIDSLAGCRMLGLKFYYFSTEILLCGLAVVAVEKSDIGLILVPL